MKILRRKIVDACLNPIKSNKQLFTEEKRGMKILRQKVDRWMHIPILLNVEGSYLRINYESPQIILKLGPSHRTELG